MAQITISGQKLAIFSPENVIFHQLCHFFITLPLNAHWMARMTISGQNNFYVLPNRLGD